MEALVTWAATARFGRLWRPDQVADWRRTGALAITNHRTGEVLPLHIDMLDDWERHQPVTDGAGRVRAPWLIVHGTADECVPASDAHDLASRAPRAPTLLVEGTGHTFGIGHPWAGSTPAFDQALEETVDWFVRHLPA